MKELELTLTNFPYEQSPVDDYIDKLVKAGTSNPWTEISDGTSGFRLEDSESGFVTTLVMEAQCEEYSQLKMEVYTADGTMEMQSVEWLASSSKGPLHTLYRTLQCAASERVKDSEDAVMAEKFITALTQDALSRFHSILYERCEDTYVSDDFGMSNSKIILAKKADKNGCCIYTLALHDAAGTEVLTATEYSAVNEEGGKIQKLYELISQQTPFCELNSVQKDVQRFIETQSFEEMFQKMLWKTVPEACEHAETDKESALLVTDIFCEVPLRTTVQLFMDKLALHEGPMEDHRRRRIRGLAENIAAALSNVRRRPNGLRFSDLMAANSMDINDIAGSAWPTDLFGNDPVMNSKAMMSRSAVLILAILLANQID